MVAASPFDSVLKSWEADEARLRELGLEAAATHSRRYREELIACWREYQLEELTLEQAADYSGLKYDTVRKKIQVGEIPNAGSKGRPRIRRGDLPARPTIRDRRSESDLADRIFVARIDRAS